MGRVLVVDDDQGVAEVLRQMLSQAGHEVCVALGGFEALEKVERWRPDMMLLDFRMPDLDGIDVLEELGGEDGTPSLPVLVFTSESGDRYGEVAGLRAGAIDYLRKGADAEVILARVESALRRFPRVKGYSAREEIVRGTLRIDLRGMRVVVAGRVVRLKPRAYSLLVYLAEREGEVVSRMDLLADVWGTHYIGFAHAVDQAVYEVRKALGDRSWIETVARGGYRFRTP
jgi:DNA-binding response OmpR family regulator